MMSTSAMVSVLVHHKGRAKYEKYISDMVLEEGARAPSY